MQNEIQNHVCAPYEKTKEISLQEIKKETSELTTNEAILDLYGRMLGISISSIPGPEITWKLSVHVPSKSSGVFECLLREPRGEEDNKSGPRMIEYVPMTLSQNNEYKEQCLRSLPKNPPSYLLEMISFKSSSLSTFMFNLIKWIRSTTTTTPNTTANGITASKEP